MRLLYCRTENGATLAPWLLLRLCACVSLLTLFLYILITHYELCASCQRQIPAPTQSASDQPTTRAPNTSSVTIVVVVKDEADQANYRLAELSLRCYAEHYRYNILYIMYRQAIATVGRNCTQTDFMFSRHCLVAAYMPTIDSSWLLFLDADIGVINPNHRLEEYLPANNQTHLMLYNRIFNNEIASGSYFVRNSAIGQKFLHFFADYFYSLPDSFHGTDNGAIHTVVCEFFHPKCASSPKTRRCHALWRGSSSFTDLEFFEVCMRNVMNKQEGTDAYQIVPKGKSWVRDGWLTASEWRDEDFLFHGWQKSRMDAKEVFAAWMNPFKKDAFNDPSACSASLDNWRYQIHKKPFAVIEKKLFRFYRKTNKHKNYIARSIANPKFQLKPTATGSP